MSAKRHLLPNVVFGLFLIGTAATLWFGHLNEGDRDSDFLEIAPILIAFASFAVVGWLVSSHHPSNPLGWIFSALAVGTAWGNATQGYAKYGLKTNPGSLPLADYMNWMGAWLWPASITLMVFIILLYPTGRPVGPRWRILVRVAVLAVVLLNLPFALAPGPLDSGVRRENPLGIESLRGALDLLSGLSGILLLGVVMGAAVSLVVRSRRSRGDERQQLKWLAYSVFFMIGIIVATSVLGANVSSLEWLSNVAFGIGISALPVATGMAIFRYRLYEIDVVINRTLVYGCLTVLLALAYFAIVVVLQSLVPGARSSDLAVAGSTLAVAALFRPARSRIQGFIDRQFYRRKYDAAKTLESFSARLRDEIDLETLKAELITVVGVTMQPTHASLWVRTPEAQQ